MELAYMLFTPGPDEAIEPLILGLSAAALVISSGDVRLANAISIAILAASIALLLWVRGWPPTVNDQPDGTDGAAMEPIPPA